MLKKRILSLAVAVTVYYPTLMASTAKMEFFHILHNNNPTKLNLQVVYKRHQQGSSVALIKINPNLNSPKDPRCKPPIATITAGKLPIFRKKPKLLYLDIRQGTSSFLQKDIDPMIVKLPKINIESTGMDISIKIKKNGAQSKHLWKLCKVTVKSANKNPNQKNRLIELFESPYLPDIHRVHKTETLLAILKSTEICGLEVFIFADDTQAGAYLYCIVFDEDAFWAQVAYSQNNISNPQNALKNIFENIFGKKSSKGDTISNK